MMMCITTIPNAYKQLAHGIFKYDDVAYFELIKGKKDILKNGKDMFTPIILVLMVAEASSYGLILSKCSSNSV